MSKKIKLCFSVAILCMAVAGDVSANSNSDLLIRIRDPKLVRDYRLAEESGNVTIIDTYQEKSKDIPWGNSIRTSLPWTVWAEWNPSIASKLRNSLKEKEFFSSIAISPDQRWVALSVGDPDNQITKKEISLISASDLREIFRIRLTKPRYVGDLAWRVDSKRLFVLELTDRVGLNPLELISAFAGHPVPHYSFYLGIIDSDLGGISEANNPFAEDIEYASGWFARSKPN